MNNKVKCCHCEQSEAICALICNADCHVAYAPRIDFTAILHIEHIYNAPLSKYTTFGVGGPADILMLPKNNEELYQILQYVKKFNIPLFVLGGGSNIVISDQGLKGIVVKLKGDFTQITTNESGTEMIVGAGATFPKLTNIALKLGWYGALGWHGTPGLVGGALKMNAGGRLGEIGENVEKIFGVHAQGMFECSKTEAQFSYRNSELPHDIVITQCILKNPYADVSKGEELLQKAKELVIKRKQTQPNKPSAGSIFKNPPGDFAGRLIEQCGLKGKSINDAQISTLHANFIININRATANDIYLLAKEIKKIVYEKTKINLEYEVKFAGVFTE